MRRRLPVVVLALAALACGRKPPDPGLVRISLPYEVDTLDPHASLTISDFATASNFYEPLVRNDAEGKAEPCLARSWETSDALTWIFHLSPGIRFHSGRLLTAADVVFSFERLIKDR